MPTMSEHRHAAARPAVPSYFHWGHRYPPILPNKGPDPMSNLLIDNKRHVHPTQGCSQRTVHRQGNTQCSIRVLPGAARGIGVWQEHEEGGIRYSVPPFVEAAWHSRNARLPAALPPSCTGLRGAVTSDGATAVGSAYNSTHGAWRREFSSTNYWRDLHATRTACKGVQLGELLSDLARAQPPWRTQRQRSSRHRTNTKERRTSMRMETLQRRTRPWTTT